MKSSAWLNKIKFSFQLAKVEVALCRVGDEIVALFTKTKLYLNV